MDGVSSIPAILVGIIRSNLGSCIGLRRIEMMRLCVEDIDILEFDHQRSEGAFLY